MTALLLAAHGPLQAWGTDSKLGTRETGSWPTRSAVLGMLACGSGRPRGASSLSDREFGGLQMLVRRDRPGVRLQDLHNITHGSVDGKGTIHKGTIQSRRWYLADAAFVVALDGPTSIVESAAEALTSPSWSLSLGRRSCPPAAPFVLGTVDDPLLALESLPALAAEGDGPSELLVAAPVGFVGDRAHWTRSLQELTSPTEPVLGRDRTYATNRVEIFDIGPAHSGTTGSPLQVAEAARSMR